MPRVLSITPTFECENSCSFCYLRPKKVPRRVERDIAFFGNLIYSAIELGFEQVAIGVNAGQMDRVHVPTYTAICHGSGIPVTYTTNEVNVLQYADRFLGADMVTLSVDSEKQLDVSDWNDVTKAVCLLHDRHVPVGINLLFEKSMLDDRKEFIRRLAACQCHYVDQIHILAPKPFPVRGDAQYWQNLYYDMLTSTITGPAKIAADDCFLLLTGKIKTCHRGTDIVSVDPYGRLSYCSFDDPIMELEAPSDLAIYMRKYYPPEPTTQCPFLFPEKNS